MPLYIHHFTLIVPKSVLDAKYQGGQDQFKKDYFRGDEIDDMEDGELLGVGYMNLDEIDLEKLMKSGLAYNEVLPFSKDFIIVSRYGEPLLWTCEWVTVNSMHVCHINASKENKKCAAEMDIMTMERLYELIDAGSNPLRAFWIKD
jgi:hypothetical protein